MHPPLPSNLVNAINDAPDDDAPRLAAADWFRENGAADRADFIEVQVAWDKLPVCFSCQGNPGWRATAIREKQVRPGLYPCDHCPRNGLVVREEQLLDVAAAEFWAEFPGCVTDWWWVRGFVEKIRLPGDDWVALGDGFRAAHPLRRVVLCEVPSWATSQYGPGTYQIPGRTKSHELNRRLDYQDGCRWLIEKEWPGVEFEWNISRIIDARWDTSFTDIPTQLQRMRDEIIRQQGIPPHLVG